MSREDHPLLARTRTHPTYLFTRNNSLVNRQHTRTTYLHTRSERGTRPHIEVADRKLRDTMTISDYQGHPVSLSIPHPLHSYVAPPPLRFHQDDDVDGVRITVMYGSSKGGAEDSCETGRRYMHVRRGRMLIAASASKGLAQLTLRFIGATNLRSLVANRSKYQSAGDAFPINRLHR